MGKAAAGGIYNIVMGTAGHIDHGKSAIVQHLTGIHPDRLPAEQERGLTIDLGFAPMRLSGGQKVGIIDVPGHERFIKNMVAGATGIDLVALVVAADDSVMPQTREHLDIMTLLGIQRGLVIINKVDLVEPDMIDLVEEEISELVAGTFLEGAPTYRVSALTGEGIDELRAGVEAAILEVPPRPAEGIFRMPIQRVFSSKGHGTIVTGIPVSGAAQIGSRLEVLPLGQAVRVRGLQAYKETVQDIRAGHSSAVNLSDVDFHDVHRGMVLAEPGYFRASRMLEATVQVLPHLRLPLRHQMGVRLHTGTAEVTGRMYLLEEKAVAPGQSTFAQFRLDEAIVMAPGDRYVFRLESPMITLGGGEILDSSAWRLKTGKQYVIDTLERKHSALGSQEAFIRSVIDEAPLALVDAKAIATRVGLPLADVKQVIESLATDGHLLPAAAGRGWFASEGLEQAQKRIISSLQEAYDRDPYRVHVPKLEIRDRTRLDPDFYEVVVQQLDSSGALRVLRGGRLTLPGRAVKLDEADQQCYDRLLAAYEEGVFAPLRLEAFAQEHGLDTARLGKVQALLLDEGKLVRINHEVTLHVHAIEECTARLRQLFEESGPFTASQARVILDTSRKVLIPLLEHMDHLKVTRRVGDVREMV